MKAFCNPSEDQRIFKHNQRYSGRNFIKFERDKGSLKFHSVCSIRIFTKFSGDPYYEPLVCFIIPAKIVVNIVDVLENPIFVHAYGYMYLR